MLNFHYSVVCRVLQSLCCKEAFPTNHNYSNLLSFQLQHLLF